ncbi:reverse transcriptase [Tanacetum coccineum]
MDYYTYVRKNVVHTLVDCGSTHNFLDLNTAKKLGCKLRKICPLEVSVANGHVLSTLYECKGFSWEFQGVTYTADVMILPLKGCKMELPPKRTHDHRIPLVPNTHTVSIRPYKHSPSQKDAIELMVKELLESGEIRNNQSPFSPPIVMVKKKDVVEELIDELDDSKFFSKLDLRSGYHQIRMEESDVYKTSFKTHEGHYEFLVMLFALTNAPSTFQSLMNSVFKEFMRKFVLVFFDDILIYNKSLKSHLNHLRQVLSVMRTNSLFSKRTMTEALILDLPNLDKTFTMETDAPGIGIGAMLQQAGHHIAFFSKALAPKHQALSTYEKEFLAVLKALEKWRGYLLDRHFKIKINHFNLKYLMGQRLTTPFQTKWLPKLLGFDYEISYKSGTENVVADALSRVTSGAELNAMILVQLQNQTYKKDKYTLVDGILRRKGKIMVGNYLQLRMFIVHHYHADGMGGHSGTTVTLHRLKEIFYWEGMQKMVKQAIRECVVYQREKPDLSAYPGLLQPLPIPKKIWSSISMDFIEKLPSSHGNIVILVVVDRLSKYAYFIAMKHPFTASTVAQVFLDNVYKLHGLPDSIISDRDKNFLSHFWQSLCMTGEKPKEWTMWPPMVEFWYNTNFHSATNNTPFQTVYGQTPPLHIPYVNGETMVETVNRTARAREESLQMVKFHLKRAQDRMASQANKHRSDNVESIGDVTYKLELPSNSQVHPVFHVSQLKLCQGSSHKSGILPHCEPNGVLSAEHVAILDRRLAKVNNRAVPYVLVKWSNHTDEDATWENYADLIQRYLGLKNKLEDKHCLKRKGLLQVKASQGLFVQSSGSSGTDCIRKSFEERKEWWSDVVVDMMTEVDPVTWRYGEGASDGRDGCWSSRCSGYGGCHKISGGLTWWCKMMVIVLRDKDRKSV